MSSKSACALLDVVKNFNASDVMEFTAQKRSLDRTKERTFNISDEGKEPPSVIVVDSKMTPLEAANLLWEHNM